MDDAKSVARLLVHADGSVSFDTDEIRMEITKEGIRIFSKKGVSFSLNGPGLISSATPPTDPPKVLN
jgi:hypothetical protein